MEVEDQLGKRRKTSADGLRLLVSAEAQHNGQLRMWSPVGHEVRFQRRAHCSGWIFSLTGNLRKFESFSLATFHLIISNVAKMTRNMYVTYLQVITVSVWMSGIGQLTSWSKASTLVKMVRFLCRSDSSTIQMKRRDSWHAHWAPLSFASSKQRSV